MLLLISADKIHDQHFSQLLLPPTPSKKDLDARDIKTEALSARNVPLRAILLVHQVLDKLSCGLSRTKQPLSRDITGQSGATCPTAFTSISSAYFSTAVTTASMASPLISSVISHCCAARSQHITPHSRGPKHIRYRAHIAVRAPHTLINP